MSQRECVWNRAWGKVRGVLFLVFCTALLTRADVRAAEGVRELQLNEIYNANELSGVMASFAVPSCGRIRFLFENYVNPQMDPVSVFMRDSGGDGWHIYWKTELECCYSSWYTAEPGTYVIQMAAGVKNPEAAFRIQFEASESSGWEIEPNDKFDTAVEIGLNKIYGGSGVCEEEYDVEAEDRDYFHFTLANPSKMTVSVENTWNKNECYAYLYSEDQNRNTRLLGRCGGGKTLRLPAGSFYLEVESGYVDIVPEYALAVNAAEEAASEYEQERNDLQSQANEKDTNKDYVGNINLYYEEEDIDWFRFAVRERSYLKLGLTVPRQAQGSVTAGFYKDGGQKPLFELESGSNPYIESEEQLFPAGTYYVRVSSEDPDADWDYKIRLSQRKVVSVESIRLVSKKTLKSGQTMTLSASVKPDDASEKKVRWSSSDKQVVSVDQEGNVKAKKKGKAVITAQATDGSGISAACKITVTMGAAEAKEIYKEYYKKNLNNRSKYPYGEYCLYDINQDGMPEMFFSYAAARTVYRIYTLKNKKVKLVSIQYGVNEILCSAEKKQICIVGSSGAASWQMDIYKLKGSRLKKVEGYRVSDDKYYRNDRRISRSKYLAKTGVYDEWEGLS